MAEGAREVAVAVEGEATVVVATRAMGLEDVVETEMMAAQVGGGKAALEGVGELLVGLGVVLAGEAREQPQFLP